MANILDNVLSDFEKEKIAAFLADVTMKEAIRKVLLAGIYYNGTIEAGKPVDPTQNFMLQWMYQIEMQHGNVSDADIGADIRAEVKAIRKVEQAFLQLDLYKQQPEMSIKTNKPNKAK